MKNFTKNIGFTTILTLCTLAITISSCNNGEENSACEWHNRKFKATIKKIELNTPIQNGDSIYTIWVAFNAGSLSNELQDLGKLRNTAFTSATLRKNQLEVGRIYTGQINDLKSGNCTTPVLSFDQRIR